MDFVWARHELDICRELAGHGLCNGLTLAEHRMGVGFPWAFVGFQARSVGWVLSGHGLGIGWAFVGHEISMG
jgi:hypothetical protein